MKRCRYPQQGGTFDRAFFKRKRMQMGLTQQDVAVAIDATVTSCCRWETGHSQPRAVFLTRMAELFCVKVSDLLI